jgi:hypothetical protein
MTAPDPPELDLVHPAKLALLEPDHQWLVRGLWSDQAVGVVGGTPKSCKTWLGLDLAVSVASATPCLDRFDVQRPGRVIVYLAEDSPHTVRQRLEGIARHRGLDLEGLDLFVVDAPALRLDDLDDRRRLQATIDRHRPAMLLLDPLVRLHRMDENSSADISRILGFLRALQRRFALAVVLVHHMAKRGHAQLGQALRGSGDIHAWADSSAYLLRRADDLTLVLEHRAAAPPDPVSLRLVTDDDGDRAHLEIVSEIQLTDRPTPLTELVLRALDESSTPRTRTDLRAALRVNNQRLGDALTDLEARGLVIRSARGWQRVAPSTTASSGTQLTLE